MKLFFFVILQRKQKDRPHTHALQQTTINSARGWRRALSR